MNGSLLSQERVYQGVSAGIACIFILLIWKGVPASAEAFNLTVEERVGTYLLPNIFGDGIPRRAKRKDDNHVVNRQTEQGNGGEPCPNSKPGNLPLERREGKYAVKGNTFLTENIPPDGKDPTLWAMRNQLTNRQNRCNSSQTLARQRGLDTSIPTDENKGSQNGNSPRAPATAFTSEPMNSSWYDQLEDEITNGGDSGSLSDTSLEREHNIILLDRANSTSVDNGNNARTTSVQKKTTAVVDEEVKWEDTHRSSRIRRAFWNKKKKKEDDKKGDNTEKDNDAINDQVANEVDRDVGNDKEAEADFEKVENDQKRHKWRHFRLILATIIIVWLCWFFIACGLCRQAASMSKKAALLNEN